MINRRLVICCVIVSLFTFLSVASILFAPPWQVYVYQEGNLVNSSYTPQSDRGSATTITPCPPFHPPESWDIRDAVYSDITGDSLPECILLVWRPWQDWPIMQWSSTASPIAGNRDAGGDSAHVILVEPLSPAVASRWNQDYREIWAGSALAVPVVHLAVGDVDGNQQNELVALEGDYRTGRTGPARQLAIWRWNGFGFTLVARSQPATLSELALSDLNADGIVEIFAR